MNPGPGGRRHQVLAKERCREVGDNFDDNFVDALQEKRSHVLRIGMQNICGFPRTKNKIKEEDLKVGILAFNFEIFALNTDWRLLPEDMK